MRKLLYSATLCAAIGLPSLAHAQYVGNTKTDLSKAYTVPTDSNKVNRSLTDKLSDTLTPKDYGATLAGGNLAAVDNDAAALQKMFDTNTFINSFKIVGQWPVGDGKWKTAFEPYSRWTPDHTTKGDMYLDLTSAVQSDNPNIQMSGLCSVEPNRGNSGAAPKAADIYHWFQNGGLYWSKCVNGGAIYSKPAAYNMYMTLNTDDNPNYFSSGEYSNTIVTDIEGTDTGRTGQLVALQVGVSNSENKGFPTQEQLINFNGTYTGHAGHWDLVGGFTDMTGETSGGGWEHTLWEADAGGVGPIVNHCNETPQNSNCGRQGVLVVPGNSVDLIAKPFSYTASYAVAYDENQNIGSSSSTDNYYDPYHSTHIVIPWRTWTYRFGSFPVQGVFRAYPHNSDIKTFYSAETPTTDTPTKAFDHYETCSKSSCFNLTSMGSGYKTNDVLTSSLSSAITATVTSVDSSGAVTGFVIRSTGVTAMTSSPTKDAFTGGSGSGFNLNAYSQNTLFALSSVSMSAGGSGYSVNDILLLPLGSSSQSFGSITVTSVDSSGAITGYTFTPTHIPVSATVSTLSITTTSSGKSAVFTPNWVYNNYVLDGSSVSPIPQFSWHQTGGGFSSGNILDVLVSDSNNITYAVAQVNVSTILGTGTTGGIGNSTFVSKYTIPSTMTIPTSVQLASPDGVSGDAAGIYLKQNSTDVETAWLTQNSMYGSGYAIGDVVTVVSDSDNTVLGTATVNNIPEGSNGQIDGNMLDLTTSTTITKDYTGPAHLTGGSGSGGRVWAYVMPSPYHIDRWMPNVKIPVGSTRVFRDTDKSGYIWTATTGGITGGTYPTFTNTSGATVNDGTVVWTVGSQTNYALNGFESGIPVASYYNTDGSECASCAVWQWSSEDTYEFGTAFGANDDSRTYMGTFAYVDQIITNAAFDTTGMTATSPLTAQLRLTADIPAIDFSGGNTNAQKNKNYLAWEKSTGLSDGDPLNTGWHQLDVHINYGDTKNPLVLLTDHHETKIPGELTVGYQGSTYGSLFGGGYPVPTQGMSYVSGRTTSDSNDWFSFNTFAFYQIPASASITGPTGVGYGKASSGQLLAKFDLSGSSVNTDLNITGVTSVSTVRAGSSSHTLTTLQSETHQVSDQVWCSDCRAPGESTGSGTGRWVYLNSKSVWKTTDGLDASN